MIAMQNQLYYQISGIPKYLRSDYGTENSVVASIHIAFHLIDNTGLREKSYICMGHPRGML